MDDTTSYGRPQRNNSLGKGYQTGLHKVMTEMALADVRTVTKPYKRLKLRTAVFNSLSDIKSHFNAGISTNIGEIIPIPTPTVGLEISGKADKDHATETVYAVAVISHTNKRSRIAPGAKLKDTVKPYLADANDEMLTEKLSLFYSKYGDRYISQIIYGSKLVLIFEIDKKDEKQVKRLLAEINVAIQDQKAGLKAEFLKNEISKIKSQRTFISAVGVDHLRSPQTPEEVANVIQQFLEKKGKEEIEYRIRPYSTLTENIDEQKKIIQLSEVIDNYLVLPLKHIQELRAEIHHTMLLNRENLIRLNTNAISKKSDPYYIPYKFFKHQAEAYEMYLRELYNTAMGTHEESDSDDPDVEDEGNMRCFTPGEMKKIEPKLAEISKWLATPLLDIIAKQTLIGRLQSQEDHKEKPMIVNNTEPLMKNARHVFFRYNAEKPIDLIIIGKTASGKTEKLNCNTDDIIDTPVLAKFESLEIKFKDPKKIIPGTLLSVHVTSKTVNTFSRHSFFHHNGDVIPVQNKTINNNNNAVITPTQHTASP